nr:substrate-binding domain-containing protein [uncultured Clostridium sp.]
MKNGYPDVKKADGKEDLVIIKRVRFVTFKKNGRIIDDTPFFSLIIAGFEKECRKNNAEMLMTILDQQTDDFNQQLRKLKEDTDTGLVILGTELSEEDIELFTSFKNPIVLLDYWDDKMRISSVSIWNEEAAGQAIRELMRNGHQAIGYLKGNFRIKAFRERERGIINQMRAAGLVLNPDYIVELQTTMDGARADMEQYLGHDPKLPTAYFADNDMIALGAMKAMQKHGIQIPQDISIIGFDDLPFSELCIPSLTSLKVPKQEMGRMAAVRLLSMMDEDETAVFRIQTNSELVRRNSVININSQEEKE